MQQGPLDGQGGLSVARFGEGALLKEAADGDVENNAQRKGKAGICQAASQEQGEQGWPPALRSRPLRSPVGRGEEMVEQFVPEDELVLVLVLGDRQANENRNRNRGENKVESEVQ